MKKKHKQKHVFSILSTQLVNEFCWRLFRQLQKSTNATITSQYKKAQSERSNSRALKKKRPHQRSDDFHGRLSTKPILYSQLAQDPALNFLQHHQIPISGQYLARNLLNSLKFQKIKKKKIKKDKKKKGKNWSFFHFPPSFSSFCCLLASSNFALIRAFASGVYSNRRVSNDLISNPTPSFLLFSISSGDLGSNFTNWKSRPTCQNAYAPTTVASVPTTTLCDMGDEGGSFMVVLMLWGEIGTMRTVLEIEVDFWCTARGGKVFPGCTGFCVCFSGRAFNHRAVWRAVFSNQTCWFEFFVVDKKWMWILRDGWEVLACVQDIYTEGHTNGMKSLKLKLGSQIWRF